MIFIEDLGMKFPYENAKRKYRYGLYKCPVCSRIVEMNSSVVKTQGTKSCQNCKHTQRNGHKDTGSKLYRCWCNMKSRCYNKNTKSYKNYGERDINVCEEWTENYVNFKDWALANGYKDGLSLDRINNDGNYEPSNCRWTVKTVQARNTRKIRKDNKTGYRGVQKSNTNGKFRVQVGINGANVHLGTFNSLIDAARAYDKYVIDNSLEHTLNFK